LTPEQIKAQQESASQARKRSQHGQGAQRKLAAAKTASDAGDFETAVAQLNAANEIDPTRDLVWFKLGDAYRFVGRQADRSRGEEKNVSIRQLRPTRKQCN